MLQKLAIITTHPIQYNAPLFRLLSERKKISVKVFYTWGQSAETVYDARFGMQRSWDIPLLTGYAYEFVRSVSKHPDSNRFWGVINPGLRKQLQSEGFDAILVYRWSLWSHFWLLQFPPPTMNVFFRGDSTLLTTQKGLRFFFKQLLLRFVYRNVHTAFTVGTHNDYYMLASGLQPEQLKKAPHAVDTERFSANADAMEVKASEERKAIGINDDDVVFHYAGKFYEVKQLNLLINAFQKLNGKQYRLLLTGNGEDEAMLKSLAVNDKRILFQGFKNQSEMPWVYRLGDVFVLPSKSETWGLSVNEAMACGRPAIVSDQCGCVPDLIVEGKNGFVFKTSSEADLLRCLQQFSNRASAKDMESFVAEHISHFNLTRVAEVIENTMIEGIND